MGTIKKQERFALWGSEAMQRHYKRETESALWGEKHFNIIKLLVKGWG